MMGDGSTRVVIAGEALVDVVRQSDEEEVRPGGSPFNVAIGLARLGVNTTLATQIGTDQHGQRLRGALGASGVLLDELLPAPQRTASSLATIGADGTASYTFDLEWDPEDLPAANAFDVVHIGSLGTILPPGAGRVIEWARNAATQGVRVTYDPNVRLGLGPGPDELRHRFMQIAAFADLVKLSDEDAAVLFPGRGPLDMVAGLASSGATVVMTRGAEGAVIAAGTTRVGVPAEPTELVDTIGAGDAFMAALIEEFLARNLWDHAARIRQQLGDVLRIAAIAAAITCGRAGADPPTRRELDAALGVRQC